MTNPPLTLRGSFSKLQRAVAKYYIQLQQRFGANSLISETWAAMGNDLLIEAESLKKLPPSFWQSLKKQEKELTRAAELILPPDAARSTETLHSYLVQTLDLEERIILEAYPPLIRRLRASWTDLALDFYVMVKAHVARVERLVRGYSGDPALSQRCALLVQNLERAFQEPVEAVVVRARATLKRPSSARHSGKAAASRRAQVPISKQPPRSIDKLPKHAASPLVKKLKIPQRRARR